MHEISLSIITFGISFLSLKLTPTKTLTVCDEFKYLYQTNNKDHCFNNPNGESNTKKKYWYTIFTHEWKIKPVDTNNKYYEPGNTSLIFYIGLYDSQTEIVRRWEGYTAEEYTIYTEDGYQIFIIRAYRKITQKIPIVIGHGLSQNSSGLVLRDEKSITKFLGDHGYDIWMINFRGTSNSLGHVNKSANNLDYWTFSFHELGFYDIPAVLDLIILTTNQKPIYLGISLGSTASYVFGSTRPDVAKEKLTGILSYAPVGYMKDIKSYVKFLAPFQPILEPILRQIFKGAIRPNSLMKSFCTKFPFQIYICETIKMVFFGDRYAQIDTIDAPILLQLMDYVPIGILAHFAQLINSGELRLRSFGESENMRRYGQPVPPSYDVSEIPVPVSLVVGENDWLGTLDNAERLYSLLNVSSKYGLHVVKYDKWSHIDFEEGRDIIPLVLEPTLLYLKDLEYGTLNR